MNIIVTKQKMTSLKKGETINTLIRFTTIQTGTIRSLLEEPTQGRDNGHHKVNWSHDQPPPDSPLLLGHTPPDHNWNYATVPHYPGTPHSFNKNSPPHSPRASPPP